MKVNLFKLGKKFLFRNRIVLISERRVEKHLVNLHWAKMGEGAQNVGDYLSTIVVEHMKEMNNLVDKKKRTKHLYAIGSIIDLGYQNATVWGSGLLRGSDSYWWRHVRKLDVRCVRGPKTRAALLANGYECPETFGDPALLMPLIYQPDNKDKKYDYRIIPHYINAGTYGEYELCPMVDDWKQFIDEIVASKLIISGSLHGIILAEVYGVPAIFMADSKLSRFKYEDYYFSTGRQTFPIAETVEEALRMTPTMPVDLDKLQRNLLRSFPSDLWQ